MGVLANQGLQTNYQICTDITSKSNKMEKKNEINI
jgi:hypothetical protein